MTFLNPLFLWGLPLIAGPVILHFFFKKKPNRLLFSSILLLKKADQALMPKKRLRELLLLIFRVLILLFLVFFFSRPVLQKGGWFTPSSGASTMIILTDVSASMEMSAGGRPAFQVGKDRVQSLLRKVEKDTRVGLVAFSDRVVSELAPTIDRSRLTSVLEGLAVEPRPTDVTPAFALAYRMLLNQPGGKKSIVVVTDGARNGWTSLLQKEGKMDGYDPTVSVFLWEIVEKGGNAGVSDASLSLSEEGALKGVWRVHTHGSSADRDWRFVLNGRVVGKGRLSVASGSDSPLPLEARLPEGGFYAGRIELDADRLPFDNVFYIAGRVPKGFRLLMVDGEGGLAPSDSEVYYVKAALESPRDPRLQSIHVIRPEAWDDGYLDAADVIVLANTGGLNDYRSALLPFVEKGGGLLVSGGNNGPSEQANAAIEAPSAWPPFLAQLADASQFQWSDILVRRVQPLPAASVGDVWLRLTDGSPLLTRKKIGKGNIVTLATTLDRSWTNLPAKPLFAPLIRELIASLADPLREQTSLNGWVGEPFRARMPEGVRRATVVAPDGTSRAAAIDQNGTFEFLNPTRPGLYHVKTGRPDLDFDFAINMRHAEKEGDPTRVAEGELKSAFPGAPVQFIHAGGRTLEAMLAYLQGQDLTGFLIALVLLLVVAETFLSWPGRRRQAVAAIALLMFVFPVQSGYGNRFVYAQLKHEGAWDPYPNVHRDILSMVGQMTNIPFVPERQTVRLTDPRLFEFPFVIVKGNSAIRFSAEEKKKLKTYIDRGGLIFFDDTLGEKNSEFSASVRTLLETLFPTDSLVPLQNDHALFRSFFLLRNVAGRRISSRSFEGMEVGGQGGGQGRTAVILSSNDLLGAWVKDPLGNYVYSCEPGGESQRWESFKLTLNLIYFSLTGTYKKDAVHQPFIEKKLEN